MGSLFSRWAFTGFGPNRFELTSEPPAICYVHARRKTKLRDRLRQLCPRQPGVYGMLDWGGELIYVGKAKNLRARLLSYFRTNSRDAKAGRILEQTRVLVWEYAPSEFAALLRELDLIRRWRPRFNVLGQPGRRRFTFVCIGRKPAPHVFLSRRPARAALACYGPVPLHRRATEAVRRVNDFFSLRDCPQKQEMIFADQAELFPIERAPGCLRYEIGSCLGPCAGLCSRSAYLERVRSARAFLVGSDLTPLATLTRTMEEASTALAFERAAVLRDKLDALNWLHKYLERVRLARQRPAFVYPVAGNDGPERWYLVQGGRVVKTLPAPGEAFRGDEAAKALAAVFERGREFAEEAAVADFDGVLLVTTWFQRHATERARILTPAAARVAYRTGRVDPDQRTCTP